jgi:hypothetical protein
MNKIAGVFHLIGSRSPNPGSDRELTISEGPNRIQAKKDRKSSCLSICSPPS